MTKIGEDTVIGDGVVSIEGLDDMFSGDGPGFEPAASGDGAGDGSGDNIDKGHGSGDGADAGDGAGVADGSGDGSGDKGGTGAGDGSGDGSDDGATGDAGSEDAGSGDGTGDAGISNNPAYNKVKSLLELGILEDVRVTTSDDEADEGTPISEFKDITEEQVQQVLEAQKKKQDEDINNSYIPKENLNETHLKLIEIMRNGGDVSTIFTNPELLTKRPFENIDLDNVENQRKIVMHFNMKERGLNQNEAATILAQKEKNFELDTEAKKIVGAYQKAYDTQIDEKLKETKQQAKEREEAIRAKRKNISETLKAHKLKDSLVTKVVNGATKPVEGDLVEAQIRLKEILEKPEENYEVLIHLLDPAAFKEVYSISTKKESTKQVLRLANAIPARGTKKQVKEQAGSDIPISNLEKEIMNMQL